MALTVEALAVAIRAADYETDNSVTLDTGVREILTRLNSVANTFIEEHASTAPDTVKEEAAVLFVGYLYDRPNFHGLAMANGFVNSGAAALLSRWHIERAAALETE